MEDPRRMSFGELATQAEEATFLGWDFEWIEGRWWEESPPWDYGEMARGLLRSCRRALDMGTGGGEFLASLRDSMPEVMLATEAYQPNIDVARRRLAPLDVEVVDIPAASLYGIAFQDEVYPLPTEGDSLDVVLCRHESFDPSEVARVLRRGGQFLTQQVGAQDFAGLNERLGARLSYPNWTLATARAQVEAAGLTVLRAEEWIGNAGFHDIGALIYYLRAVPWQVEGVSPERRDAALRRMHEEMSAGHPLHLESHRFLLLAEKR